MLYMEIFFMSNKIVYYLEKQYNVYRNFIFIKGD